MRILECLLEIKTNHGHLISVAGDADQHWKARW